MFEVWCLPRVHGHKRTRQRHWLLAASMIDWSNCALHSSIRLCFDFWIHRRQQLGLSAFSVEYLSVGLWSTKLLKSRGALCRIDNANVSNLIPIITALCNILEHLRLTLTWVRWGKNKCTSYNFRLFAISLTHSLTSRPSSMTVGDSRWPLYCLSSPLLPVLRHLLQLNVATATPLFYVVHPFSFGSSSVT